MEIGSAACKLTITTYVELRNKPQKNRNQIDFLLISIYWFSCVTWSNLKTLGLKIQIITLNKVSEKNIRIDIAILHVNHEFQVPKSNYVSCPAPPKISLSSVRDFLSVTLVTHKRTNKQTKERDSSHNLLAAGTDRSTGRRTGDCWSSWSWWQCLGAHRPKPTSYPRQCAGHGPGMRRCAARLTDGRAPARLAPAWKWPGRDDGRDHPRTSWSTWTGTGWSPSPLRLPSPHTRPSSSSSSSSLSSLITRLFSRRPLSRAHTSAKFHLFDILCVLCSFFRASFSQMLTDLDEISQESVVARNTLVGSIWPRSVHGRLQAKR